MSLEWTSPLDRGVPKEKHPSGEGLGRGYETCEAMTGDIVLPNVSTLMHVFSATLT